MGGGRRANIVRDEVRSGILNAVLSRTGYSTTTGGGEEAARLLSEFTWAQSTWTTRASQIARWMRFCDEDMRSPLPAEEGDILAYVGFLSLEGRIKPESLPQYLSAISQYHELHYLPSPTKTPLVRALVRAYTRSVDSSSTTSAIRVGLPASVVRTILHTGMLATNCYDVGCCAATVFAFVFQCRSVSLHHLSATDVRFSGDEVTVTLFRRKGKSIRRPLILTYPAGSDVANPIALFKRWVTVRSDGARFFNMVPSGCEQPSSLGTALEHALSISNLRAPEGYVYRSHSPRIGGFNELLCLQFPTGYILRRLDWASETMMHVYADTSIRVTDDSRFFFAHMHPASAAA